MHWGLMIVGWLVLLIRPSVGMIGLLSLLLVATLTAVGEPPELWAGELGEALGHTLIFLIGAAFIVALRGDKSGARKAKQLDKEIERVRAELAARDAQPPTS